MMTDKYEEFKNWCFERRLKLPQYMQPYFDEFEKEQKEKEKEIIIKNIISCTIFNLNYYNLSIGNQKKVTTAYNNIKNKDLLK